MTTDADQPPRSPLSSHHDHTRVRRFVTFMPALIVLIAGFAAIFAVPEAMRRIAAAKAKQQITLAQQQLDSDNLIERLDAAIRAVAASVEPSVVHIDVVNRSRAWDIGSTGSGWVYDDRGHIITNAHVAANADEIRVQFSDGRAAAATVIGADPFSDIAVLRVAEQPGLFPLRRATGAPPRQGDRVFSFGSPFGFKFSMSEGIISGLGRIAGPSAQFGGFSNYIQTDAAVNPGNSGGPLVDANGRVIGMNVAIATARDERGTTGQGQSSGISFAIPLATIESVADQLINTGRVSRGFLGIAMAPPLPTDPPTDADGALLVGIRLGVVQPGTPAQEAGLERGDLILSINGQPCDQPGVVSSVVGALRPGDRVHIRYWRDGEIRETHAVLAEMPASTLAERVINRLGIALNNLSPLGPWVLGVYPDGPAAQAELPAGVIITHVGPTRVTNSVELGQAVADQGWLLGRPIELTFIDPREQLGRSPPRSVVVPAARD